MLKAIMIIGNADIQVVIVLSKSSKILYLMSRNIQHMNKYLKLKLNVY